MDRFMIQSPWGDARVEFFKRTPDDVGLPLELFKVRLKVRPPGDELSVVSWIYGGTGDGGPASSGSDDAGPASMFVLMAARGRWGFEEFSWESFGGGLTLRGSSDRTGRVAIRVGLRSVQAEGDWSVAATVAVKSEQLDEIAARAIDFFGRAG